MDIAQTFANISQKPRVLLLLRGGLTKVSPPDDTLSLSLKKASICKNAPLFLGVDPRFAVWVLARPPAPHSGTGSRRGSRFPISYEVFVANS